MSNNNRKLRISRPAEVRPKPPKTLPKTKVVQWGKMKLVFGAKKRPIRNPE